MVKQREIKLLTCHIELFSSVMEEMKELNKQHYDEISEHKKKNIPLNPDYNKYFIKEQNGELLYVALRHYGKLVGYYIGFIGPGLHYKDCLTLFMDILFVGIEVRGQKADDLIIKFVENEAKRRNVKLLMFGYKERHKQFLPNTYKLNGYEPFDHIVAKWL